jgi:hypothetical protein
VKPVLGGSERSISRFDRHFFDGTQNFTVIGSGSIGGKAKGMAFVHDLLEEYNRSLGDSPLIVNIPTLTVIAGDHFEHFLKQNDLYEVAYSDLPDDRMAHAFQKADLPPDLVGDLRALIDQVHSPLAVRSSSYLEDAMFQPFASVYTTKMIPNNQPDTDSRFRRLIEAVKYVYASTFFRDAKNYIGATTHSTEEERMAVIIQEVVGQRHGDRFYPHICGVARSYNYYPFGHAAPEDGVVDLALGLGRIIVEDGKGWTYSPAYPNTNPPFNSVGDLVDSSQTEFWSIHMGPPPPYDPIRETEWMMRYNLAVAEEDQVLDWIASTYDPVSERLEIGVYGRGPKVLSFAPILQLDQVPLNRVLREIMALCKEAVGSDVEIEFAVNLETRWDTPSRLGFLQVRPMVISQAAVEVSEADLTGENLLLSSTNILGNGDLDEIRDIVYVKPDSFSTLKTWLMAAEIEALNFELLHQKRPYLLIGFGRWGTTDPLRGIPVNFGQISGAKAIVESTLPSMYFSFSQGSHFFHNMTSFQILYFYVSDNEAAPLDWEWLERQRIEADKTYTRWISLDQPLRIKADARQKRGVVLK